MNLIWSKGTHMVLIWLPIARGTYKAKGQETRRRAFESRGKLMG